MEALNLGSLMNRNQSVQKINYFLSLHMMILILTQEFCLRVIRLVS